MIDGLQAIKLIREKKIKFPLLLWGPEVYLRDRIKRELINSYLEKRLIAFNFQEVKNGDLKINEIVNTLLEPPLLSPGRIFFIHLNNYSKSDLTQLAYSLEKIELFNTYFVGYSPETLPQEFTKVINSKGGTIIKLSKPIAKAVSTFIKDLFSRAGVIVEDKVIETLVNDNRDLQTIRMETEKLILFALDKKTVLMEDLMQVYSPPEEENIFSLIDNLFEGKTGRSLRILTYLTSIGEPPSVILSALAYQVRGAFKTLYLNEKETGLHPYVYRKLKAYAQRMHPRHLELALLILADTDEKIKSGRGDSNFLINQAVIKVGQLWKTRLN